MPLDLFQQIKSVESSPDFKAELSGSYFCSAISFIQPEGEPESWDLNYYNPEKHEIATIHVSGEGINHKGIDKPFKDSVPKKVNLPSVSVAFGTAYRTADNLRNEKYRNSQVKRVFASLYAEDTELWSISFILGGGQILQVKIDAAGGDILESKMHNMMQKEGIAI